LARTWKKSGAIGNEMRTNMSFGHNIRNICQSISDNIKEHMGDCWEDNIRNIWQST
jgi:hypothetical protein